MVLLRLSDTFKSRPCLLFLYIFIYSLKLLNTYAVVLTGSKVIKNGNHSSVSTRKIDCQNNTEIFWIRFLLQNLSVTKSNSARKLWMASVKTHNPAPSPILVVNPVFQNWCQDDAKKNQRALAAARVENRHLDNWSLSDEQPNTSSAAHFKSASMFSSNRVVACFLIVVCLVSISALVLTIMMLFGKIGDRCGCSNTQGMIQF